MSDDPPPYRPVEATFKSEFYLRPCPPSPHWTSPTLSSSSLHPPPLAHAALSCSCLLTAVDSWPATRWISSWTSARAPDWDSSHREAPNLQVAFKGCTNNTVLDGACGGGGGHCCCSRIQYSRLKTVCMSSVRSSILTLSARICWCLIGCLKEELRGGRGGILGMEGNEHFSGFS